VQSDAYFWMKAPTKFLESFGSLKDVLAMIEEGNQCISCRKTCSDLMRQRVL
jgi:hypothetical protein